MIQVIYGKKGSGKTKRILDMANHAADEVHGDVVFVDDDTRYMYDLRHEVRFVNASEYKLHSADMFYGFLCGMLAQNFDMKVVFIDAFLKLCHAELDNVEPIITVLSDHDITRNKFFDITVHGICKAQCTSEQNYRKKEHKADYRH